jgi:hypothetical protein
MPKPPPLRPPLTPEEEAVIESAVLGEGGALPERTRTPSRKRRGPFVPAFPYDPFTLATRLSATTAVVWILIWRQTRLASPYLVTVPTNRLTECGISRSTFMRALRRLEAAGLILTHKQGIGRPPEIELIELPESAENEEDE